MRPPSDVWECFVITERDNNGKPRRVSCKLCSGMRAANSTKMAGHLRLCQARQSGEEVPNEEEPNDDSMEASSQESLPLSDDLLDPIQPMDDSMSMSSESVTASASASSSSLPRRYLKFCCRICTFFSLYQVGEKDSG